MKQLLGAMFSLSLLAVISAPVPAQDLAPRNVRDLIGARASSGESALKNRGYELYNSQTGSDRIWSNWWNQEDFTCISVVTKDGKYDSIVTAPTLDCGISGSASHSGSGDDDHWYDAYVGGRPSAAEAELKRRGFTDVRGTKEGYKSLTWWHKASNDRCLKMTVSEGRVESIRGSGEGCNSNEDDSGAPPEIMMGSNGEGEVIFKENNCVVYYSKSGGRKSNLPACTKDQISHADNAMKAYRTEQGMH